MQRIARDTECEKWLKGRVRTTPIAEAVRADVISSITHFLSPRSQSQVLIVSYETFRLHSVRGLFEARTRLPGRLLTCVRFRNAGALLVSQLLRPAHLRRGAPAEERRDADQQGTRL